MIGSALIKGISSVIGKHIDNKDQAQKLTNDLIATIQKSDEIQGKINTEEARHASIFVAGWRPALGWLCVLILAYSWLLRDWLVLLIGAFDSDLVDKLPNPETGELLTLIIGMLGMGALRTAEKIKHVARK